MDEGEGEKLPGWRLAEGIEVLVVGMAHIYVEVHASLDVQAPIKMPVRVWIFSLCG